MAAVHPVVARYSGWGPGLAWLALVVIVLVPRIQAIPLARKDANLREWAEVDNNARQTLLQVGGGILVMLGVVTAYQQYQDNAAVSRANLSLASQALALSRESQQRERLGRTLDQVASDQEAVRVAGVYALEGISRERGADEWAIAEILAAFVRTHATRTEPMLVVPPVLPTLPRWPEGVDPVGVHQDVQAALTVLGRNSWRPGFEVIAASRSTVYYRRSLDLRQTDLRGADLSAFQAASLAPTMKPAPINPPQRVILINADLTRAVLTRAHIGGAQMSGVRLDQAWLAHAVLAGADLSEARLIGSALRNANLHEANLSRADLRNADLSDANLGGAYLRAADLRGADLTSTALAGAEFREADVAGAKFSGATLCRTRMSGARGLVPAQLMDASVDDWSTLPKGFEHVPRAPHLRGVCGPPSSQGSVVPGR
jgi:uncharacterized protein YjbI with pentapeptide repeats